MKKPVTATIKADVELIICKAITREYPIRGKITKFSREEIASFLLQINSGKITDFSQAQEGLWRQIKADFDRWIRNARSEGIL